tara:strand:+ start:566 stop:1096 length:531 start_codon:yes stop_codon:yes gene_type:complete
MSNLRLINQTTISSSTSALSITDVFSADFDIYKIVASGILLTGTTQTNLSMRLINSSGSVLTGANDYAYATLECSANTTFSEYRDSSGSLWQNFFGKDDGAEGSSATIYVFNPYSSSSYTFGISQSAGDNGTALSSYKNIGVYQKTESIGGFQLLETATRPFDEGLIKTFGLRLDT